MDAWRVTRLGLFWASTTHCPRCTWMAGVFVLCLWHSRLFLAAHHGEE